MITTDDIFMAREISGELSKCKICGHEQNTFYDGWEHSLTDCLRRTTQIVEDLEMKDRIGE